MDLKDFVVSKVNSSDYYASRFPKWNPRVKENVKCLFHDSTGRTPSLAINLKNGGARCHNPNCAKRIGNVVHFESEKNGIAEHAAAKNLYAEFVRPVIPFATVANFHANLLSSKRYITLVQRDMGLSVGDIRRFKLGLDLTTHRIIIPIYDNWHQLVNYRNYRLPSERTGSDVKIYNLKGHGRCDLFPHQAIQHYRINKPLYFMASEKETMLAIGMGLQAICTTTGEGSWDESFNEYIKDYEIRIIYDNDRAGVDAAEKIKRSFATVARNTISLKIPFKTARPDRKDFADYVLKEKGNIQRLLQFNSKAVRRSVPKVKGSRSGDPKVVGGDSVTPLLDTPKLPPYYNSEQLFDIADMRSNIELLNHRIRCQAVVAAKAQNTYTVPWKFRVKLKGKPETSHELPMGRELLRFVRATDEQVLQQLQMLVGVKKDEAEITPYEHITAHEVEVIPTAVVDRDVPYVMQRCFYFGKSIEANVPYYLDIIPTSEIRTQETIGIITDCIPISKSIDNFNFNDPMLHELNCFAPSDNQDPYDKLTELANEISERYTKVYNRLDWHLVALLTWASPIGWKFPHESELQRGWVNSLVVGDTETGKSKVAKSLRTLFNCGVYVSAENCTFVGLVGGAIKMGSGQLMLRWGRIPLSDKQLVVLEELSGLSVGEISNMSDVRSSGVARLDKGGLSSETNARTRLLCISNVRAEKKTLSNYLYGVHAIQELIGHGEDIARFDMVTTLVDKEVSNSTINEVREVATQVTFTPELIQKLIHFIWALSPEQIHFTEAAHAKCLQETLALSTEYHPSVPIFKGGSGRYKLARVATAIACFLFSWDGQQVVVTEKHIATAAKVLRLLYNKPSLGYQEFSEQLYAREKLIDVPQLTSSTKKRIPSSRRYKVLGALLHATSFNKDELISIAGVTALYADQLIGKMFTSHALRKGDHDRWDITPAGKVWFSKMAKKRKFTPDEIDI